MENKNEKKNIKISEALGLKLVDNFNYGFNLEVNDMVTLFIRYHYTGKKCEAILTPNRKKLEKRGIKANDIYVSDARPSINFNPDKDIDKIVKDIKKRLLDYTLEEYTDNVTKSFNDLTRYKNKVKDGKEFLKSLAPSSYRESTYSDKIELYEYKEGSQWIELDSATTKNVSISFESIEQMQKVLKQVVKLMNFTK